MTWPYVPLSDACTKITDGSHRTPTLIDKGYPFLTVANVGADGSLDFNGSRRISDEDFADLRKNDCRPLQGDVLFSKDGTVGKVAVIDFDLDFTVLSSLAILRPDISLLEQRFLAYALKWDGVLKQAIDSKSGSAIRRIVLKDLSKVRIPLPPLPDQRRIVAILDAADDLRRLRAEADRRTAGLIPAIFHDMFGDPATNPKRWPIKNIEIVCTKVTDGTHDTPAYVSEGVPLVTSKNLRNGTIDFEGAQRISFADHDAIIRRSHPEPGDILLAMIGTIGNPAIVPNGIIFSIKNVALFKPDQSLMTSEYLHAFLSHPSFMNRLLKKGQGGTQQFVGLGTLRSIVLPVPPIHEQKAFASSVAAIRALQESQAQSRRRMDDLFQSLLHRAFQGNL